jgi:hypothetical protein
LQGGARGGLQVVKGRSESRDGHGRSSNRKGGPKGPGVVIMSEQ